MAVKNFINLYGTRYDLADGVNIAGEFSTSGDYYVSDLVIYQGTLYRCIATHEHAAWNSSHFAAVTLGDELNAKGWNHAQLTAYYNAHGIQKVAYPFDRNATYQVKDYATYAGGLYQNKTGVTGTDPSSDTTNWEYVPPVRMPDVTAVADRVTAVESALETKAEIDGSYDSMTVGNAEQLVSTVGIEDKVPYLFRTTGGSADVGDRVKLSEITGVSYPWNQKVQNGDFSDGTNNWNIGNASVSVSNNVITLTPTAANQAISQTLNATLANHVYIAVVDVLTDAPANDLRFQLRASSMHNAYNVQSASWQTISMCFKETELYNSPYIRIIDYRASDYNSISVRNVMFIDLTLMFGSTIADYLYSLETANAGAGIAQLKAWGFCTKPYYAYDAGSILSVKTTAHREVGFNQFDKSAATEGKYIAEDGTLANRSTAYASGFIQVVPNTSYYFNHVVGTASIDYTIFEYDASQTLIGKYNAGSGGSINNGGKAYLYTTSENAHFLRFTGALSTIDESCLNLHWDGERDGEYEPYEEHTYPLDDVELRGIPKLDANNNLYYDGDTYASDGTVSRRFALYSTPESVTITANACVRNESGLWCAGFGGLTGDGKSGLRKAIVSDTMPYYNSTYVSADKDGLWMNAANTQVAVIALTDATSGLSASSTKEEAATALQSYLRNKQPTIVYELETPTTEEADPYQETQICNDFGTEEFIDTRTVPIPVGYTALYQPNLRAKLEMAPDSPADGDGDYIVRQTNGENSYVKLIIPTELPTAPTTDGSYHLKCTVASGTATLTWEADE